jgi:D-glycerate 3-kinase
MFYPTISDTTLPLVDAQIKAHRLPSDFINTVTDYYWPLCWQIRSEITTGKCNLVGIQGSQGSGKSTCASFVKTLLENEFKLKVLVASIDDFYLTQAEREVLAKSIHPLLRTRGAPGTHDLNMIDRMLNDAAGEEPFSVPSFSKALDERSAGTEWPAYQGPFDVVILEGWCVGIPPQKPQALLPPVNDLERLEDMSSEWRNFINNELSNSYRSLFKQFSCLISLQAPSFSCIYSWRLLQEQKLIEQLLESDSDTSATMSPAQITRFIAHYQRLTEHALEVLPALANIVLYLDKDHHFTKMTGITTLPSTA